ncbi:MAG TPA: hypothetical protein VFQ07_05385 [Candidatus Polarisedimenticolia bacterium]|nr:hypothetical protein [Candidatus Polarisedimenticolia bacterium]
MRHRVFVAACGVLALALTFARAAQEPKANGTPQPAPQPPAGAAPAESAGALSKEEAAALAAEVSPIVEDIRGAKFAHPVPVEIVDDQAARAHFKTRLQEHWPEEARRAEETVDAHLGLIPPKTDLEEEVFDVLEEQAGGYYDPDRDTFFVLGDMPRAAAPIIVAHELTHALDDQRYGIDRLLKEAEDDDDRSGALEAVVEGSGTVVMTVFIHRQIVAGKLDPRSLLAFQESEVGRAERLKASPLFVQRSLIAPYILGMAFLLRGELIRIQTGGITPSDLDRAFSDPPRSTEQILHPEKYWDPAKRDLPRGVVLPDLASDLGPGWSRRGEGNLGELTLGLLTGVDPGDPTSPDRALERWTNAASTGWGGDRWNLYRSGEKAVTVLATSWDTEKDAREFAAGLTLPPGATVRRKGETVVVIAGDAGDKAKKLADRAVAGVKVTKVTKP